MKVYIGPYRRRWYSHIHYDYMNKKYNHDWTDSTTTFEHLLEKYENFLDWIYNNTINRVFDLFKEQKIKIRIDDYDVWSMDDTLALIISPMLKKLKEHKHGSAYVDNEDVSPELQYTPDPGNPDNPDHDNLIEKRWDYVLGEMIWAFEHKVERAYSYSDDYKERQKRMSNGFRLFGKYYESLWD
jgi:hypothetical protein